MEIAHAYIHVIKVYQRVVPKPPTCPMIITVAFVSLVAQATTVRIIIGRPASA